VARPVGCPAAADGRRQAAFVLGQQQAIAELGRLAGLALADGAGVGVAQAHQPVGDHPVAGQPLVGLGQQPPGRRDRLGQLLDQPTQPPIAGSTPQRPPGIVCHRLHLLQGVPRDLSDLAGEPVDLGHRYLGAPAQGPGQPFHPPPSRPASIAEPGPAGRPTALDPADQPTELADRTLQQIGVGRVVDVGLDHGGVDPQLGGPQQLALGELGTSAWLSCSMTSAPARPTSLTRVVGWGTGRSSPIRQNRRQEIESATSRHRLS
jgi:hypothetical protein